MAVCAWGRAVTVSGACLGTTSGLWTIAACFYVILGGQSRFPCDSPSWTRNCKSVDQPHQPDRRAGRGAGDRGWAGWAWWAWLVWLLWLFGGSICGLVSAEAE